MGPMKVAYRATFHCERFPGTGLAVREHANVIPVCAALGKLRDLFEHFRLGTMGLEYLGVSSKQRTGLEHGLQAYPIKGELPLVLPLLACGALARRAHNNLLMIHLVWEH